MQAPARPSPSRCWSPRGWVAGISAPGRSWPPPSAKTAAADLRERLLSSPGPAVRPGRGSLAATAAPPRSARGQGPRSHPEGLPSIQPLKKSTGEVAQAAAHWSGAPWLGSPAKAHAFWRRVRREAELLQVSTIHSLALRVLSKGEGSATPSSTCAIPPCYGCYGRRFASP